MEDPTMVVKAKGAEICCETKEGAAYVKKICHPPTMTPDDYRGIPDCSTPNVVLMEVKGETQVPPILTYPATATTTTTINPSSILLVSPSGGRVGSYVFCLAPVPGVGNVWIQPVTVTTTTGSWPLQTNVCPAAALNTGYNFGNSLADVARIRTTYKSETYYLNSTDFNNQGVVTTAKFQPNLIGAMGLTTLLKQHSNCPKSSASLLSAVGSAMKVQHNRDGDFEVINPTASTPTAEFSVQVWELPFTSSAGIAQVIAGPVYYNSILPSTSSGLLNFSSKAATRPAREGAFIVHQQCESTVPFVNLPASSFAGSGSVVSVANAPIISLIRVPVTSGYNYAPLYSDSIIASATSPQWSSGDMVWNNLDWSMTLFEAISIPSTVATSIVGLPYISVKTYAGMEIVPQPNSSLLPFQTLLPFPDPMAIQMATGLFHNRPDSLPASANDFGTIAPVILKMLPTAIDWLTTVFKKDKNKDNKKDRSLINRLQRIELGVKQQRNNDVERPKQQPRVNDQQRRRRPKPKKEKNTIRDVVPYTRVPQTVKNMEPKRRR